MIKVEVTERFNLAKFNELQNIERKSQSQYGVLFVGDKFECTEEMCEYLTEKNSLNRSFVKIIEIIPEKKVIEPKKEIVKQDLKKPIVKKTTTKKSIAKK